MWLEMVAKRDRKCFQILILLSLIQLIFLAVILSHSSFYSVSFSSDASTFRDESCKPKANFSNPYKLDPSGIASFFEFKEQQYLERRERISRLCNQIDKSSPNFQHLSSLVYPKNLIYDDKHSVSYCQIAKVKLLC